MAYVDAIFAAHLRGPRGKDRNCPMSRALQTEGASVSISSLRAVGRADHWWCLKVAPPIAISYCSALIYHVSAWATARFVLLIAFVGVCAGSYGHLVNHVLTSKLTAAPASRITWRDSRPGSNSCYALHHPAISSLKYRIGLNLCDNFAELRFPATSMIHLILCREYPPAPYAAGGIGTYALHITRLLAEAGERVHLIAQRWAGAPDRISTSYDGRLIVHRISLDEPMNPLREGMDARVLKHLASSTCPSQLFAWQAAHYAEHLIEAEPINLIEAQEWEAPLYYLQVRRALGLGPRRQPPMLVHLHSPSQMIFEHNEWDKTLTDFLPLSRFEEYTIKAADALVCPSRYLAKRVCDLFRLDPDSIEVVPYPMGDTPFIDRGIEVWARDAICYVGRLELRKGVVEWVDAAINVANDHPTVSFDFLGSDTSLGGGIGQSVRSFLRGRIPRQLHHRFRFHGSRSRSDLLRFLAQVAVAVVPSRWENLPFACIEAMATGLPVLISPNGGMAELVADDESGWIAAGGTPADLKSALLRVLATPPQKRQRMGNCASETIRRVCCNEVILERHIELRQRVARTGAGISKQVPGVKRSGPVRATNRSGLGIVVTCFDSLARLEGCIESIVKQSVSAATVVVVDEKLGKVCGSINRRVSALTQEVSVLYTSDHCLEAARRVGAKALLEATPGLRSIAWIDEHVRLEVSYVSAFESIFECQPHVGLVSPWIFQGGTHKYLDPGPSPVTLAGAAEWESPQCSAIRVQVLLDARAARHENAPQSEAAVLYSALTEGGWSAVTYPGFLVSILPPMGRGVRVMPARRRYSVMALIQSGSAHIAMQWFLAAPWQEKARWIGRILSNPQLLAQWIDWQLRRTILALRPR
jgi:glycogen(starch) synthase